MVQHPFRLVPRPRALVRAAALIATLLALLAFASGANAAGPAPTGTITTGNPALAPIVLPAAISGYYGNPYGAPLIEAGYLPPGTYDGITCNDPYGCPYALPVLGTGTTYVRGNLYCGLYVCGILQPIQR